MKLNPAQIEPFLKKPPKDLAAALFFGSESSLVSERANALARNFLGENADPLLLVELDAGDLAADSARLAGEAAQIPMFGGRRVIRISGAGEAVSEIFEAFLSDIKGDALIVVEAGEVKAKGALVRVFEESARAAAIPCYEESEASIGQWLDGALAREGIEASPGIVSELSARLGTDRAILRSEIAKLALYLGASAFAPKQAAISDLDAAIAGGAADLDDLASAVVEGNLAEADRLGANALEAGASPVTILRAVAQYATRLHAVSAAVKSGADFETAFRESGRFLPNKMKWAMQRQMNNVSLAQLENALAQLLEAERLCKSTGYPEEPVCHRALLTAARHAQPRAR